MNIRPLFHAAAFHLAGFAASALLATGVQAGDAKAVLDKEPATYADTGWDFTMVMPGWLAGIEGTVGVKGVDGYVDDGFDDIIDSLGFLAAASVEGRNGKFGFILEGIYTRTILGGPTPGPILSTVDVAMEQVVAEGTLTYRFLESDRAWVEFLAGARYTYMGADLSLVADPVGIENFSETLSEEIVGRAAAAVRAEVDRLLPSIIAGLAVPTGDVAESELQAIEDRVLAATRGFRDPIRDGVNRGVGSRRSGVGALVEDNERLRRAVGAYVDAQVEARVEAERAADSALVAAARAAARAAAERRLAKAEAALAKAIERRLNEAIPDTELHASKAWVDPFVGFRGRYNLNDQLYLTGRGDIGGFGVSSESAWNVYGALGFDLSPRTCVELGYRYYQVDYERGALDYDVATKGPFIGVRIDY
ncbi:MAG: hypothetical protein JNJ70_21730 [Verrucomicrobiales bacterium]|nr:hypothetical protein [Verrucomicrobiales bacterium]